MILQNEELDLARYKSAAAELDSTLRDEGLWIKAFAEAGGDDKGTRAMYIKLRVEQLRKSAVANAARKVVGESTAAPSTNTTTVKASPVSTSATTPPPPSTPQGPARVAQTLYDIVGVNRDADAAEISAAIQVKKLQTAASNVSNEDRKRSEILLQHAGDVLLNVEKRQSYDSRVFAQKISTAQPQLRRENQSAQAEQSDIGALPEPVERITASSGKQVAAAAIDWGVFILPLLVLSLFGAAGGKAYGIVAIAIAIYQLRLMRLGLTIGKGMMGVCVIDADTHEAPSIMRGIVLHAVIPLSVMFAVGMLNDYLFFGLLIVDFLFVFGDERRCLHDLLAGTKVVTISGSDAHKTPDGALERLQKDAEQGIADAQVNLGVRYAKGDGVVMNEVRAVDLYRKAAVQGHAYAQHNLGIMYYLGTGIPKDIAKAKEWIQKAAEQGLASAQHLLGAMYSTGEGVSKDAAKAIDWYLRAAAQGHADAQNSLGMMYSEGDGIPKDVDKAVEWFRRAAAQGDAAAQCNLGALYALGEGIPKDAVKAVNWYRQAATQGLADAQYYLGIMYSEGDGVPQDAVLAYAWLNLAAISNRENAIAKRDATAFQLSKAELAEAQRLSSGWTKGQNLVRQTNH